MASPNPGDQSTAFIADDQGRPLLTPSRKLKVFFTPSGSSQRNLALTTSPIINKMTGASFYAYELSLLASIRRADRITDAWLYIP